MAGLGFLFFVLLITSFFGQKGLIKIRQAQRKPKALLQEISELEKEKRKLEKEIEELEKNPKAVEMEARKKLWLMKQDEIVVIKKKN